MMGTAYPEQVADTTKVCAVAERDLDRLEKWAGMKHIKFNEGKCKVLHLGGIIPSAIQGLRSSLAEGPAGCQVEPCQQCVFVVEKINVWTA